MRRLSLAHWPVPATASRREQLCVRLYEDLILFASYTAAELEAAAFPYIPGGSRLFRAANIEVTFHSDGSDSPIPVHVCTFHSESANNLSI